MKIIGIMLVQNEDLHISWAIQNILEFCDEILIFDHQSKDGTQEILKKWATDVPKITVERIKDPRFSHEALQKYVNTATWIFAVDGDEIYDPIGLKSFRLELESGKYDRTFSIYGHTLNCRSIDFNTNTASGYITPDSKSVTKIYNFQAITKWEEVPCERLHGGKIEFNQGFHYNLKYPYMNEVSWEEAMFRCLHACFMKRSTIDKEINGRYARPNIYDLNDGVEMLVGWRKFFRNMRFAINGLSHSKWKLDSYAKGNIVKKEINSFL